MGRYQCSFPTEHALLPLTPSPVVTPSPSVFTLILDLL